MDINDEIIPPPLKSLRVQANIEQPPITNDQQPIANNNNNFGVEPSLE